ncbi:response to glucocorticoid [Branchiostoma belcheri]|nr:response to glucocorticoid [Branchiostoma belcheri]
MDGFGQWQAGFSRGPPNLGPRPPPHPSQFPFHPNPSTGLSKDAGLNTGQQQNQNNEGQHFYPGTHTSAPGYTNMGQQQQHFGEGFSFNQGSVDSFNFPTSSSSQQQYDHSRTQIGFPSGPPMLEETPQDMGHYADHGARDSHFANSMQSQQPNINMAQHGTAFQQNVSSPFAVNPPSNMLNDSGGTSSSTSMSRGFVNNSFNQMTAFPPPVSHQGQEFQTPKQRLPNVPPPPLFPPLPNISGHLPFTANVRPATTSGLRPSHGQTSHDHSVQPSDDKVQADADRQWLSTWLSKRGLGTARTKGEKGPALTLPEVRQKLAEWRSLLDQLTEQKAVLTEAVGADESTWQAVMTRAADIKGNLTKMESMFGDEQLLTQLERKLSRIQKKRARMRRLREESYRRRQEDEQRCQDRHQKIDKWRNNILQKDLDAKREAELKKEVDDTLSEVRRKQSEATKSIELLKSLGKLRKLRKEANERKDPLDTADPLLPYRQYYEQGDNSVQSLLHIRREWDMYLVPDGTVGATGVPLGWVVPSEPTSEMRIEPWHLGSKGKPFGLYKTPRLLGYRPESVYTHAGNGRIRLIPADSNLKSSLGTCLGEEPPDQWRGLRDRSRDRLQQPRLQPESPRRVLSELDIGSPPLDSAPEQTGRGKLRSDPRRNWTWVPEVYLNSGVSSVLLSGVPNGKYTLELWRHRRELHGPGVWSYPLDSIGIITLTALLYLSYRLPELPTTRATDYPCYRLPVLPTTRATDYPCYRLAVLPTTRATDYPCYRLPVLPTTRATDYPCYRLPVLPTTRAT